MQFDDSFFGTEVRDGFEVPSLMKRAWAAQIEILEDVRRVCEKYNITFFADYGTLLGAVRHKGYIPWDDDLDIGMMRADVRRFIEVAPSELPPNYRVLNMHTESDYRDIMTRVINSDHVSMEPAHMEKYHGCPYVVGIDIFPYDYIPRDREELSTIVTILDAMGQVMNIIWGTVGDSIKYEAAKQVEVLTGVNLDWSKPIDRQVLNLYENLTSMYTEEESDCIGIYTSIVNTGSLDYCFDKEWFSSMVELPFENITLPAPVGYDAFLRKRFGDYMTPVKTFEHDYPFYKGQVAEIKAYIEKNPQNEEMWKPYII